MLLSPVNDGRGLRIIWRVMWSAWLQPLSAVVGWLRVAQAQQKRHAHPTTGEGDQGRIRWAALNGGLVMTQSIGLLPDDGRWIGGIIVVVRVVLRVDVVGNDAGDTAVLLPGRWPSSPDRRKVRPPRHQRLDAQEGSGYAGVGGYRSGRRRLV